MDEVTYALTIINNDLDAITKANRKEKIDSIKLFLDSLYENPFFHQKRQLFSKTIPKSEPQTLMDKEMVKKEHEIVELFLKHGSGVNPDEAKTYLLGQDSPPPKLCIKILKKMPREKAMELLTDEKFAKKFENIDDRKAFIRLGNKIMSENKYLDYFREKWESVKLFFNSSNGVKSKFEEMKTKLTAQQRSNQSTAKAATPAGSASKSSASISIG